MLCSSRRERGHLAGGHTREPTGQYTLMIPYALDELVAIGPAGLIYANRLMLALYGGLRFADNGQHIINAENRPQRNAFHDAL